MRKKVAFAGVCMIVASGMSLAQSGQIINDVICTAEVRQSSGWRLTEVAFYSDVHKVPYKPGMLDEMTRSWRERLASQGYSQTPGAYAGCHLYMAGTPLGGNVAPNPTKIDWNPPTTILPANSASKPKVSENSVVEITIPSESSAKTSAPAKSKPAAARAELVDTPSGKFLMTPEKKAEYEAKLAEHERLAAERERMIAETAAKHASNKAAAEARQAQHERELAAHREMVAQMERDTAARRAAWAAQSTGRQLAPAAPSAASGEMTVRRVASIGGGSSEEAARNDLLNGFHKQFGPITNIQCSYIIFNGRREWTCTGDQAVRKVAPQSASGQ